jgi:AcrR family transcriptional regulator
MGMAQQRNVTAEQNIEQPNGKAKERPFPPGRIKIANAFVSLLEQKEFSTITTAEIAKKAEVTEALIYKYFEDKRDLLHQILKEYLEQYLVQFERDLKGIKGALNKIRKLIWGHINVYSSNRVFAKILFLEVRNHLDYYKSDTYQLIRTYSKILLEIIEEGVRNGEIRSDIPPKLIRQVIFGSIEHVCLTGVIFNGEISPDDLTDDLCEFIFRGIEVTRE